jgi:hypothetical protein
MERVKALINKLQEQVRQGADPASMMGTVQLLQMELGNGSGSSSVPSATSVAVVTAAPKTSSSKISVVLPSNGNGHQPAFVPAAPIPPAAIVSAPIPEPIVPIAFDEEVKTVFEPTITTDIVPEIIPSAHAAYMPSQPPPIPSATDQLAAIAVVPALQPATSSIASTPASPAAAEAKVLAKELNDAIAPTAATSLNESLKTAKTELADTLTGSPIKDLKKAIGVNDKFLFINELFRGDEAMYERSLKTINNFNVFQEAEYWIVRELKIKLAWEDSKETTKHFFQLVRRRFA